MIRFTIIAAILTIALSGCKDDDTTPRYIVDKNSGIDLRNVQAGDVSKYVLYTSACDGNFRFTGDTLEVKITQRNDSLFLNESYTAGSVLDFETEHVIIPRDEYILIPHRFRSQFLFFYGNDTIFLDRPANAQLKQNSCRMFIGNEVFVGDEIGSVDEFRFGELGIVDGKGVSCVPTILSMEAYIFYDEHLNLVHTIQTGEEETIFGFMAITP